MTERNYWMDKTAATRVLTVPGWNGSGPGHWQTIWEERHPNITRVQQGDWQFPRRESWVAELDRALRQAASPAVLVAHSLGCLTVAHWAKEMSEPGLVTCALLVAPPWFRDEHSCPAEIRSFVPIPLEALPFRSLLVTSENDPYIPYPAAQRLASAWGSEFVNAGYAGHINVKSGHGEWPDGEALLENLIASCRPVLARTA
jgi:serine hydrolase